jgi:hypothetical protein
LEVINYNWLVCRVLWSFPTSSFNPSCMGPSLI